jgi:transcriptional regulator GlxA family with amidase domain
LLELAVTVIGIHNPQGFAVLEASNYKAPINALTLTCGITACSSPSVLKAIRRLDTAPEIPTSLAELAALSGVSRFQLLRGFARDVGTTPHAYLIQRRVRLVRRLLAASRSPVDAALLAGFADQSHMTRAFVRQFGITPGRYKAAIA